MGPAQVVRFLSRAVRGQVWLASLLTASWLVSFGAATIAFFFSMYVSATR